MGEVPLSVHVTAEMKQELENEARLLKVSESDIASQAIEHFLNLRAHKRDAIAAAVAEADKGVFISGDAMHRWIESWDTGDELPPPEPDIFPDTQTK